MTVMVVILAGCSTMSEFRYPPTPWLRDSDNAKIAEPKASYKFKDTNSRFGQMSEQAMQVLDFSQDMVSVPSNLSLAGEQEAINVNNFDEVADSTWFTNRIGRTGIFTDPFNTPPDTSKKWKIIASTGEEGSREFVIEDARGNDYLIRTDHDADGLSSSGEVLGALFLASIGYNVTENYIVELTPKVIDKKLVHKGADRALATRIPKGKQLGQFQFEGKRKDDPNDRIQHEHKREIRGLETFAAFLNNKDISTANNLDIYSNGFVTHYLTNLTGPLANMRSEFLTGSEKKESHTIDALFSFGFYNPYWTSADTQKKVYKGVISSEKFKPNKWQPTKDNTAFKYATARDSFWAAKVLSHFTDQDIAKIASLAEYKDQEIENRIISELITRRNKIVSYWFGKLNPLDHFDATDGTLSFKDQIPADGTRYRYRIREPEGQRIISDWQELGSASIPLPQEPKSFVVQIQTFRKDSKWWSNSVDVYFKEINEKASMIGIHRRALH